VKHSRDDGQCYAFLERLEGIMEAMSKVAQACDKLVDHRAIPENGRLNPDETARTLWAVHHQLVLAFMASQDGVGLDYLRWSTNFYLDKRASFTRTIESGGLFPVMNMFLAKQPNGEISFFFYPLLFARGRGAQASRGTASWRSCSTRRR